MPKCGCQLPFCLKNPVSQVDIQQHTNNIFKLNDLFPNSCAQTHRCRQRLSAMNFHWTAGGGDGGGGARKF